MPRSKKSTVSKAQTRLSGLTPLTMKGLEHMKNEKITLSPD